MSLRLFLLERHLPSLVRRRMLQRLVATTADAFGVPQPVMPDPGDAAFVQAYARFTQAQAARVGADTAVGAVVRERLYRGSHDIGRSVRRWAGIRTDEEAIRALRLIYEAIGIDLHLDAGAREVTVRRCAFSAVYTPGVCHFVSALDAGLFRGISGTWGVAFTDRITDGAENCSGHLTEAWLP